VYPNVGKVWDFATRKFHDHHAASDCALSGLTVQHTLTQEQYVQMARQWRDAGAFAVGGCCHTTPAIIRAMKMALVQ
jgi:S-methylmethionine-dependent homocysteine/selenocysteine methylase